MFASVDAPPRPVSLPLKVLVTAAPLASLVQDLYAESVQVEALTTNLNYHAPQYGFSDLQAWQSAQVLLSLGAEAEPQWAQALEKLGRTNQTLRQLTFPQPADKHTIDQPDIRWAHHAHPWLSLSVLRQWARALIHMELTGATAQGQEQERLEKWLVLSRQFEQHWRVRFESVAQKHYLQEHAAFEALTAPFGLVSLGALSNHHDVPLGVKSIGQVQKKVTASQARCFIVMPHYNGHWHEKIFTQAAVITPIDPMLVVSMRDAWQGSLVLGALNQILEKFFHCLTPPVSDQ